MVKSLISIVLVCVFTISCSSKFDSRVIEELYVQDFQSTDIASCTPSDDDLNHAEALEFFHQAKSVDSKIIHDHYIYAPCYIEGTLKYQGNICDWNIRAGQTGAIICKDEELLFACDKCESLFE